MAPYKNLAEHLEECLKLGLIGQPAYRLGLHVLARMSRLKTQRLVISHDDMGRKFIAASTGKFLTRELDLDGADYSMALVALHNLCGIRSALTEEAMEKDVYEGYHFAFDPTVHFGRQWSKKTPIIFDISATTEGALDKLLVDGAGESALSGEVLSARF